jgi:hypothetical protein
MSDVFEPLEQYLRERHHQVFHQIITEEHALDTIGSVIEQAGSRVPEWANTLPDDFSIPESGLERVYTRGRKAMARAYAAPTPEDFHEWRKCVKYLWYYSRLLRPLWPDVLSGLRKTLHQLAKYLGDAHDLANVHTLLVPHENFCQDQTISEIFLGFVQERRQILQAAARLPGERIFVEKPVHFSKRIAAYWDAAHKYRRVSPLVFMS